MTNERKVLDGQETVDWLKRILQPRADEIAHVHGRVTEDGGGIVIVVDRPGENARAFMDRIEITYDKVGTTVFGLVSEDAADAFDPDHRDHVTRKWIEAPPKDSEIRILLISGDGSALLTLVFGPNGIEVRKEPDVYPLGKPS